MTGLLGDSFDDPRSAAIMQLAGGLLSGNFGQGVAAYGTSMAGAKDAAMKRQFMQSQIDENTAQSRQVEAKLAEAQRIRGLVANFGQPMPGMGATGQVNDALPPELRMGAQSQLAAGRDYEFLLRQGVPFELVKQLADSQNLGRQKVARTADIEGPNGSKMVQGFDDYGMPVGQAASGYVAPQLINQGDRQVFAKPLAGAQFGMNLSPSEREAAARGREGLQISRERLAFDQRGGAEGLGGMGKAPAGYRFKADGSMEFIPGGPADLKAGAAGTLKTNDAQDALSIIDQAEKLIPQSTGSGMGALADSAAGFFGSSTKGAQAGAQLKALEGMLVSKMPKMTGPQSDKDVLLYKQMAGQVGDTSLPSATRMAALQTIRTIQQNYAGQAGEPAAKPLASASALPGNPSAQTLTKGQTYRLPNGVEAVWDGMKFKGK